ncbi:hypothetical protein ACOJIV_23810 [Haloarcula sp. AONF1]
MRELPIKLDTESLSFDVTGPEWLVNLGWWLKDGGASGINDIATLGSEILSFVPDEVLSSAGGEVAIIGLVLKVGLVVLRRSKREIKMVRYASAHGSGGAQGSVRAC